MSKTKTIFQQLFSVIMINFLNTDAGKKKVKQDVEKQRALLSKVIGQLVFSDTKKPLHSMEVELWDRDIGTPDEYLGKGITDQNGNFEIYYDPKEAGFKDAPDLELRVIETRSSLDANNEPILTRRVAYTIKGPDQVTEPKYDFGICQVPYWIYNPSTPFARVLFTDLEGTPDEDAIGRKLQGYEAANQLMPIRAKHIIENTLNPDQPTLKEIQAAYPPNLTIELDKKNPGYSRSDEYFGERVLNGMNPCLLKKNQHNPNQYKVTFNWDKYQKNPHHDLHNVDAFFELKDGKFLPTAMTIQSRYSDADGSDQAVKEPVTYTPNDGEKWLQAKRVFRTNYFFWAELTEHYIKAHLQMEQYTIAAFRNLRKNPIRLMLIPHLKSLININRNADQVLVDPQSGYVTNAGPLTAQSVVQICQDQMSKYDWKGWKPRQPLSEGHTYAKVANLYWQLLTEYIDVFFQKYQNEIESEWIEIHRLSDDLVEHSVAYEPDQESNGKGGDGYEWYDVNELDKLDNPRHKVNGVIKVVSPITLFDKPHSNDIQNLKEFCRFAIFHVTLWHSWVNDAQTDDGGEVAYSSLALRNGSFGSEDDPNIAPDSRESTQLLYIVNVLTRIKYGYILKNEDGDIPEEFRTILLNHKQDFADLGFDVNNIRAVINI